MNPLYKNNVKHYLHLILAVAIVNHHAVPQVHDEGSCKPVNESGVTVVIHSLPTASQFILHQHM